MLGLKNISPAQTKRENEGYSPDVLALRWNAGGNEVEVSLDFSNLPTPFSESDSSQNEMLFQGKKRGDENALYPPLFRSPSLLSLPNTVELIPHSSPSCVYYSHTLTHCFTP